LIFFSDYSEHKSKIDILFQTDKKAACRIFLSICNYPHYLRDFSGKKVFSFLEDYFLVK